MSTLLTVPMRIPAGEASARGTILITPRDSRDWDRFLQGAKMKEEIIWEGARPLLFPDISPITQGKREELTVVRGRRKEGHDEKHVCIVFLSIAKSLFTSSAKPDSFWEVKTASSDKKDKGMLRQGISSARDLLPIAWQGGGRERAGLSTVLKAIHTKHYLEARTTESCSLQAFSNMRTPFPFPQRMCIGNSIYANFGKNLK